MSWKNANVKAPSLVSKLMLLYSLSTIGIILAIGLFLYPTINQLLQHSTASANLTIECFKNSIIALLGGSLGAIILGYIVAKRSLRHH